MVALYSLLVFVGLLSAWGISHLIAVAMGAPTVSSKREVVVRALKLANAKPGERFIDLGCGYGVAISHALSQGLKAEGIEISPTAWLWNRLMGRNARLGDLRKIDLKNYDIVFLYLLPGLVKQINFEHLKAGARIIAVDFPPLIWKPAKAAKVDKHKIYLYRS